MLGKKVHAFLNRYEDMKGSGLSLLEIARKMEMSEVDLRSRVALARAEKREDNVKETHKLRSKGLTNVAIANKLGVSESTVRNYLREELVSMGFTFINLTDEECKKLDKIIRDTAAKYGVEVQIETRESSNV